MIVPSERCVGRESRSNCRFMRSCGALKMRYKIRERRVNEERKIRARKSQKRMWMVRVRYRVVFRRFVLAAARVLVAF